MSIFAIVNQKGGVAKTTTAINLAACLVELGKKVLIIDTDPQANLTHGLGFNSSVENTIYECLVKGKALSDAIYNTKIDGLDIVPSNIRLANAELELAGVLGRETLLRDSFAESGVLNYDYIFIDCSPNLGLLTVNALAASEEIIIPLEPSIFALEGISYLVNIFKLVKKKLNNKLNIKGVLLTRVDSRTNIAREFEEQLYEIFKEKVFKTVIHQNVKISEAQAEKLPVNYFDKNAKGTQEYLTLAKELINRD